MRDDDIKPTHKVSLYGVRCYFDATTSTMWGTNLLWDHLIPVVIFLHPILHRFFPNAESGAFPMRVLEEYEYE